MAKLKRKPKLQNSGDISSFANLIGGANGSMSANNGTNSPTGGLAKMAGSFGKGNKVSRLEKNPEQIAQVKQLQDTAASIIPYGNEVMAANKLIGGFALNPDEDGINRASYGSQLAYNLTPLGQVDRMGKGVGKLLSGDLKGGLNTIANPFSFKKDNDAL